MVERWERVKELFEAALDKPAVARAAFLAAQCGGDTALRSEIESLLGEYERLGSFLNKPAAAEAAETILFSRSDGLRSSTQTEPSEPVFLGQEISHYKVHEQIGSGGMGAVYRAEDLASRREVALKFLTKGANAEKNALERFRREARIAESLIHPNICAFYEIDEAAGVPFISMELLHGQTIHQSIFRKAATGTGILDDTPFVPVNV